MNVEELKKREDKIIDVAKWCFDNRGMLEYSKDMYVAELNIQLKSIFSDIIDKEAGEGIIYDELSLIPIIFERYKNKAQVSKRKKEIIEKICNIIILYAEKIESYNVSKNPGAPGESEGR